jgi:hypothetical protein
MGKLLAYQKQESTHKYSRNSIYALKCPDCGKRYLGQTGSRSKQDLKNIWYHRGFSSIIPNFHNTCKRTVIPLDL